MRFLLILLTCLISWNLFSQSIFEDVATKLKSQIKKVTLENGLTLLMMKRTNSPTLALYTKFKAGASDETPEISGTAHLLEHMLFKGTKNIGTSDYSKEEKYQIQITKYGQILDKLKLEARDLTKNGQQVPEELSKKIENYTFKLKYLKDGQKKYNVTSEDSFIYDQHGQVGFNAYTTNDVTNYQIQLPSNRLEIWAKLESDRLKNPVLREYYTERDVVIEERRMRVENRGNGLLREKFYAAAFKDEHPYGRPVIGYESNLPFLDILETEKFFKDHYSPNNMCISIVGDLDFDETEKMIRKYFIDLQPSEYKSNPREFDMLNKGEQRVTVEFPNAPMQIIGFHKPTFPHKDNSVFDLIDAILSDGPDSRLYKRLILKEKLVQSINAFNGDPGERYSNLFSISSSLNSDADPAKVEAIILEEIEKLRQEDVTKEEITKVKNKLITDFLREIDNNSTLADTLSYYELVTGNWENLFKSYTILDNVSIDDIKRVSNQYLKKENMTVGNLIDSRVKK